jgi:hypothetical protein
LLHKKAESLGETTAKQMNSCKEENYSKNPIETSTKESGATLCPITRYVSFCPLWQQSTMNLE